jgi:hypothetical protein
MAMRSLLWGRTSTKTQRKPQTAEIRYLRSRLSFLFSVCLSAYKIIVVYRLLVVVLQKSLTYQQQYAIILVVFCRKQVYTLPRFRPYGKKEKSLTPLIIIINILIAGVLVLMLFFALRSINSEEDPLAGRGTVTAPEIVTEPLLPLPEPEQIPETAPASMTRATTTPPVLPEAPVVFVPGEFDKVFFENDLFIGDSIMTGISLYGHIPASNVFAKVGLNPDSVRYTEIDEHTAFTKATEMQPPRIFIMLGSNGIGYMTSERMVSQIESFITALSEIVTSEIIILTIPSVTAKYEEANPETIEKINDFNTLLLKSATENNFFAIDTGAILQNSAGFLAAEYAEVDGLHFKSAAYKAMLSYIQYIIENS